MSSHFLSLSRRIRKTHFTDRVIENGVRGFTVYNHMLLPTYFKSIEEDYHHLKNEVQVWDVSCERQVQIKDQNINTNTTNSLQEQTFESKKKMNTVQVFIQGIFKNKGF